MTSFRALLEERQKTANSILGVGFDPKLELIPKHVRRTCTAETLIDFTLGIAWATVDYACCFKPNWKYFLRYGPAGLEALEEIVTTLREVRPDIPIIIDSKTTDTDSSVEREVEYIFDVLGAHAMTICPRSGMKSFAAALRRPDKTVFALCRMSNQGADEFQDQVVIGYEGRQMFDYENVALRISREWDENSNCGLVVGATCPGHTQRVRSLVGEGVPILAPGYGRQGAVEALSIPGGVNQEGRGYIACVSGVINYASDGKDYADAASHAAYLHREMQNPHR